jgi:acetyltransferase
VAEHRSPDAREPEILAVGRLSKAHLINEAELAVLIVDEYQGRGLGTELSRRLLEIARVEKVERVTVEVLGDNRLMLEICREVGFHFEQAVGAVLHGTVRIGNA